MTAETILTNAILVLPGETLQGTLVIRGGRIAEIQPGMTERDVYNMMQARTRQMGLGLAWAAAGCPTQLMPGSSEPTIFLITSWQIHRST